MTLLTLSLLLSLLQAGGGATMSGNPRPCVAAMAAPPTWGGDHGRHSSQQRCAIMTKPNHVPSQQRPQHNVVIPLRLWFATSLHCNSPGNDNNNDNSVTWAAAKVSVLPPCTVINGEACGGPRSMSTDQDGVGTTMMGNLHTNPAAPAACATQRPPCPSIDVKACGGPHSVGTD